MFHKYFEVDGNWEHIISKAKSQIGRKDKIFRQKYGKYKREDEKIFGSVAEKSFTYRIRPFTSNGIYVEGIAELIQENVNKCVLKYSIRINPFYNGFLMLMTGLCMVFVPILVFTTDSYPQTINGISTIVYQKPLWAIPFTIGLLSIFWLLSLALIVYYKKHLYELFKRKFNVSEVDFVFDD
jgi:hypothetical protein